MEAGLQGFSQRAKRLLRAPLVLRASLRDRAVTRAPKYRLAACAIFREEAPFLAEWIEFHRDVGFDAPLRAL